VTQQVLRVGVIGAGEASAVHIPGLRQIPEVSVVAVCAAGDEPVTTLAQRYSIPAPFDDFREMLREVELDAVTIAAPLDLHHPVAIAAAEQHLHILCGAPMARSAAEARDMHRLAEGVGIRHAIGHAARYLPARLRFKQLVDRGFIGDLQAVTVSVWREPQPRQTPASFMQEVASEYADALRWWFGEIHGVVGARTAPAVGGVSATQPDAQFSLIVRFASGAIGTIHAVATTPVGRKDEVIAVGTGGMLTIRGETLSGAHRDEGVLAELPIPEELAQFCRQTPDPRVGPFALLAYDWVHGILDGDGNAPSFEDGMRVQEIVDGAMRSQELERWIDISGRRWPM
jgi:predicted dehydrogenase